MSKCLFSSVAAWLAATAFLAPMASAQSVDHHAAAGSAVMLESGFIDGKVLPSGVTAFFGIPFAAAPLGDLRWREPQPVRPWSGVLHADRFAPECIQTLRAHDINHYFGEEATSEDCLYLNVWAPPDAKADSRRPVVVWIYGGGFTIGSAAMANYRGESLARKGVIHVTVAYRVGALGFLSHPGLTAESPHRTSGNQGFLDQIAALQWVQRNIAKLGGDAANVTIMGQSAGATSVSVLQASPLARGLFHRVVGMSGGAFGSSGVGTPQSLESAHQGGPKLQEQLKAGSLAAMRSIPADRILQAQLATPLQYGPVIDGYLLPAAPADIFAAGKQSDVPTLIGFTRDEAPGFGLQARGWARAQAGSGKSPVYAYLFSRVHPYAPGITFSDHDPKTAGAYHTADVPYWLGTLDSLNLFRATRIWTDSDRKLAENMTDAIVAFAMTGNPNPRGAEQWPAYRGDREQIREFGETTRVVKWPNVVAASAPLPAPAIAAAPSLDDRYPARRTEFAGGVVGLTDLTYSTLNGFRPITLDLYRPAITSTPHPLVIYVHGGGWQSGHTRHSGAFENWPGVLASIAARGYVVVSLEYRLSSEARFPAAIQDVKAAIRWLRANAAQYGIDPQRAVIWGGSAGGQLAALAGTTCGVKSLEPSPATTATTTATIDTKAPSDCVQGVVAWYGIFDFATLAAQSGVSGTGNPAAADSAPSRYLGCELSKCAPAAIAAASASTYVDSNDPPVLLIHGVNDRTVSVKQSQDFLAKLKAKGVRSELIEIPAVDHSFIGASAESTRDASLQAFAKTLEFIDRTIGPGR